jgi:hypothetical protein
MIVFGPECPVKHTVSSASNYASLDTYAIVIVLPKKKKVGGISVNVADVEPSGRSTHRVQNKETFRLLFDRRRPISLRI